jgi:hypothetical protein
MTHLAHTPIGINGIIAPNVGPEHDVLGTTLRGDHTSDHGIVRAIGARFGISAPPIVAHSAIINMVIFGAHMTTCKTDHHESCQKDLD